MESSKPGQTPAVPSGSSPTQQLCSSNNELPTSTSTNKKMAPNLTNKTSNASLSVRSSPIVMPWETATVKSQNSNLLIRPNINPPRPNTKPLQPNTPNKRSLHWVSPKPTTTKAASKSSIKRPIQKVEVFTKAQSAISIESVRSKMRQCLAASLTISTREKIFEDTSLQNEEEQLNMRKEEHTISGENSQHTFDDNILKASREDDEKSLATKIEAELFRLFGGVNIKYQEKCRSLLSNLKDVSNPELRVRLLSGDIKPEKLCLMSAKELASKELSESRQSTARERAQAIIWPDDGVDMRKRVKKTHKGEFVGIEEEKHSTRALLEAKIKAGANAGASTSRIEQSIKDAKVENEVPDSMIEIEFENVGHLGPVVTLDEFMTELDSEPPFTDLGISNSEVAVVQADAPEQTKSSTEREEQRGAHSDLKNEGVSYGEAPGITKNEDTVMAKTLADKEGKVA